MPVGPPIAGLVGPTGPGHQRPDQLSGLLALLGKVPEPYLLALLPSTFRRPATYSDTSQWCGHKADGISPLEKLTPSNLRRDHQGLDISPPKPPPKSALKTEQEFLLGGFFISD